MKDIDFNKLEKIYLQLLISTKFNEIYFQALQDAGILDEYHNNKFQGSAK